MDRIESLANTLSQVTVYDIKSMYNQAKNMVLNVSEMEAKVREATNDEPWGASSTLMQDIAQGTFNFQNFNEIMPCIYSKFMEKEARQWREIYKALQLLEYLIKNGSERVVDDARSHISTIKMLRSFHYIDDKGKDQGINVRNRAKEIVELLSDVEKIRTERRKAKANRSKYIGTGNDPMSFTSGGGRYGGFGSDSLGYSGGGSSSYGGGSSGGYDRDYGGYSGGSGGFRDATDRRGFEEYDAGDDEEATPRRSNSVSQRAGASSSSAPRRAATQPAPAPPAKEKESEKMVDLLGLDDDFTAGPSATPVAATPAAPTQPAAASALLDDDFGDFSTAPVSPPPVQTSAPPAPAVTGLGSLVAQKPAATPMGAQHPSLFGHSANVLSPTQTGNRSSLSMSSPPLSAVTQPNSLFAASQPLTPASQPLTPASPPPRSSFASPVSAAARSGPTTPASSKPSGAGAFDDLWSMGLGSAGGSRSGTPANSSAPVKKSIKDLEKEKAQAGIWGAGRGTGHATQGSMGGFGAFGGASANTTSNNASTGGGLDDLLL